MSIRRQPMERSGIFGRLLKRQPKRNAIAEIRDMLRDAEDFRSVQPEQIQAIATRYGVRLHKQFQTEREAIYREFLASCLADHKLDDDELSQLRHLQRLFDLTDPAAARIRDEAVSEIYEASVSDAVADGHLTDAETAGLLRLRDELTLDVARAEAIYANVATQRVQRAYDEALADQRLSPEEDVELQEIARSLDVTAQTDASTRATLERFRLLWLIENGEIPPADVDIKLQRKETCYAIREIEWHELRRVTTGVSYAGPTARIRVAKGVYWRMGHLKGVRHTSDQLMRIDAGTLYLTTKRLIFMGSKGNKTIQLNKILTFEPYSNGIEIQKETGKNPVLLFDENVEVFAAMLQRAWSDVD